MDSIILIVGISANLVATIGGVIAMANKLEDRAKWQGWADTKIKSHCRTVSKNGVQLLDHERRISTVEGEHHNG